MLDQFLQILYLNSLPIMTSTTGPTEITFHLSPTKCKNMIISRKKTPLQSAQPLLGMVELCTKSNHLIFFGGLLSSEASWTAHRENSCAKLKELIVLSYRRLYNQVNITSMPGDVQCLYVHIWNMLLCLDLTSYWRHCYNRKSSKVSSPNVQKNVGSK